MPEKSEIKQRMLQVIDSKAVSLLSFYNKSGITRGILEQDTSIKEDTITKFIGTYPEVSLTWLILGKGEMIVAEPVMAVAETQSFYKKGQSESEMLRGIANDLRQIVELQKEKISVLQQQLADCLGNETDVRKAG